jgi:hypothetical protein
MNVSHLTFGVMGENPFGPYQWVVLLMTCIELWALERQWLALAVPS